LNPGVLVEILVVAGKLLLGVDVLKHLCGVPPLLVGLNKNGVRLDLLNELLSSLGQHGRLICGTNKENFLAIESLCEMDESALKTVLSKQTENQLNFQKLTYRRLCLCSFHEHLQPSQTHDEEWCLQYQVSA
jgi:hypothetical protein